MKWKQLKKKLSGDKGYCLALIICTVAVAVSGWLFVQSLREEDESQLPEAVQAAVLPTVPVAREDSRSAAQMPVAPAPSGSSAIQTTPEPEPEAVTEPVAQTQAPTAKPTAALIRPVDGAVIQGYSMEKLSFNPTTRDWRTHAGMDLAAPEGSAVRAVAEGNVVSVYEDDMLGWTVTIEHADGCVTHYANLAEELAVQAGDRVEAGQTVGTVGKTALGEVGSASHLHFAVYKNNVPQDPEAFLAG